MTDTIIEVIELEGCEVLTCHCCYKSILKYQHFLSVGSMAYCLKCKDGIIKQLKKDLKKV